MWRKLPSLSTMRFREDCQLSIDIFVGGFSEVLKVGICGLSSSGCTTRYLRSSKQDTPTRFSMIHYKRVGGTEKKKSFRDKMMGLGKSQIVKSRMES
jgi:hypothetical protein